jgi:phage baseplate assembly protein W
MDIAFPFGIDSQGRARSAAYPEHIRQLIEQLLFTEPGERVNRPDLGCGLMGLAIMPNSNEVALATQALVQNALQQWLADLISVEAVQVDSDGETLRIGIQYVMRQNQQRQTVLLQRPGLT